MALNAAKDVAIFDLDGTLPRERIAMVFDDRDKVVAMWRRQGLTCLQVAPGDF